MRILLTGDTHCNVDHMKFVFNKAKDFEVEKIVVLGDFGYWPCTPGDNYPMGNAFLDFVDHCTMLSSIPLFWLDGNHENHTMLRKHVEQHSLAPQTLNHFIGTSSGAASSTLIVPAWMRGFVYYIPRGSSWTWDGVKFMAMGGAYSVDKNFRKPGYDWFPEETITDSDIVRALDNANQKPIDVMLTHDTPYMTGRLEHLMMRDRPYKIIPEAEANRKQLERLMVLQPKMWFHGHYHARYTDQVKSTKFIGLDCDGTGMDSLYLLDTDHLPQQAEPIITSKDLDSIFYT